MQEQLKGMQEQMQGSYYLIIETTYFILALVVNAVLQGHIEHKTRRNTALVDGHSQDMEEIRIRRLAHGWGQSHLDIDRAHATHHVQSQSEPQTHRDEHRSALKGEIEPRLYPHIASDHGIKDGDMFLAHILRLTKKERYTIKMRDIDPK
eukprot:261825_1